MMELRCTLKELAGDEITTLRAGDIIAFDPAQNGIIFIRPSSDKRYGFLGTGSSVPSRSLRVGNGPIDFIDVAMLISAVTGLAIQTAKGLPYKAAFCFVAKE